MLLSNYHSSQEPFSIQDDYFAALGEYNKFRNKIEVALTMGVQGIQNRQTISRWNLDQIGDIVRDETFDVMSVEG